MIFKMSFKELNKCKKQTKTKKNKKKNIQNKPDIYIFLIGFVYILVTKIARSFFFHLHSERDQMTNINIFLKIYH